MPTLRTELMELKPSTFCAHLKLRLICAYNLISHSKTGEVYAQKCISHDNEVFLFKNLFINLLESYFQFISINFRGEGFITQTSNQVITLLTHFHIKRIQTVFRDSKIHFQPEMRSKNQMK
ncbi:hypothetical protein DM860_010998 [Cuscuta australis]|uniref:Uncharacterized protein n=1 Tax=Cuscuta australis TaxID=267555 RepID=A0A328E247_9ASTE|nr:hypothetical protein DM860_010998 [Cuscuta australis]